MLALYIIIAVFALLFVLSFIKLNVHFSLAFEDKIEGLELTVQYLFIKRTILPSALKEPEEDDMQSKDETEPKEEKKKTLTVKMIYYLFRELRDDIFRLLEFILLHTVRIDKFTLETRIGTQDPMITGMATGAANGFIYNILALLDRHKLLKRFSVSIDPDWNNRVIKGGLYVKVYTTIFNVLRLAFIALGILLRALWLMRRYRKTM